MSRLRRWIIAVKVSLTIPKNQKLRPLLMKVSTPIISGITETLGSVLKDFHVELRKRDADQSLAFFS